MSYLGGRRIYIDSDGNEHFDYEQDYEPKLTTNADRIRSMSDEELADCLAPTGCPYDICPEAGITCNKCWLDWLKQEANTT